MHLTDHSIPGSTGRHENLKRVMAHKEILPGGAGGIL